VGRIVSFAVSGLVVLAGAGAAWAAEPLTNRQPSVGSVIATPAQDLNLKRTDVPEVLRKAAEHPYDIAGLRTCRDIAAEIARLDEALGADADAPAADDNEAGGKRTAVTALGLGVQALIPYRGVIRQISGANAADRALAATIQVGFARRGFLKGRAVEMNCPAGASPAGYVQRPGLAAAPLRLPPAPDLPPAPLYSFPTEAVTASPAR
jgi:hypothetical protein